MSRPAVYARILREQLNFAPLGIPEIDKEEKKYATKMAGLLTDMAVSAYHAQQRYLLQAKQANIIMDTHTTPSEMPSQLHHIALLQDKLLDASILEMKQLSLSPKNNQAIEKVLTFRTVQQYVVEQVFRAFDDLTPLARYSLEAEHVRLRENILIHLFENQCAISLFERAISQKNNLAYGRLVRANQGLLNDMASRVDTSTCPIDHQPLDAEYTTCRTILSIGGTDGPWTREDVKEGLFSSTRL